MSEQPAIDPQMLERLRRGVPLVLAPTGRFRFDGEDVTHERVEQALRAGLDVSDAGEPIVHLGSHWCYLQVEDCPLRVTAVAERDGSLWIRLDDAREVPLERHSLWEEPERGLRIEVSAQTSGRPIAARFTNPAQVDLSTWVVFDDDEAMLDHGGMRTKIPAHAPSALTRDANS